MTNWKSGLLAITGVVMITVALVLMSREPVQAAAQGEKGGGGPRYTVVETQGHNLLVTDNGTNMTYYYTIDKDEKVGSDLKLRASVDLSQVGKDVIKIKPAAK